MRRKHIVVIKICVIGLKLLSPPPTADRGYIHFVSLYILVYQYYQPESPHVPDYKHFLLQHINIQKQAPLTEQQLLSVLYILSILFIRGCIGGKNTIISELSVFEAEGLYHQIGSDRNDVK